MISNYVHLSSIHGSTLIVFGGFSQGRKSADCIYGLACDNLIVPSKNDGKGA